jgi:hypothetical protein
MLKALEKARGNKVLETLIDLCMDIKPVFFNLLKQKRPYDVEFFKQRYRAIEQDPYWNPSKYWSIHLVLKTYIALTCFDKPGEFKAPNLRYRSFED